MKKATQLELPRAQRPWRGPTIGEIAKASRVGTATVDRVLNGRDSVRETTRMKVLAALAHLSGGAEPGGEAPRRRISFVCDSGVSFNRTLQEECLDNVEKTPRAFNKALKTYLHWYNNERHHFGLNLKKPSDILKEVVPSY